MPDESDFRFEIFDFRFEISDFRFQIFEWQPVVVFRGYYAKANTTTVRISARPPRSRHQDDSESAEAGRR